jgi:adenosylcobyric acid synthase
MARSLMVLGTGSHVGKSLLTAALCRIFRQDGWSVAPFKAQNMALNSAATPDGLEIGRAQAVQAEAAGISASADMNPVLLKPERDTASQVIVQGRVLGRFEAADYHGRRTLELFPRVIESFERLAAAHDLVILEGAGSPAEFNLRHSDIVNLRMAAAADAACLLVGDIDRGGVFASLLGTLELVEACERERIRGFAINRFRGDFSLLEPALAPFERRLGRPCLGVVPWLPDPGIEEEDGVAAEARRTPARCWPEESGPARRLRVGVVALPHLANFTDFDSVAGEPSVALAWVDRPDDVFRADLVVLPGTKQTLEDLRWLETRGLAAAIVARAGSGAATLGICGGYQMLGRHIEDAGGLEGGGAARGLGLLPLKTRLGRHKTVVRAAATAIRSAFFGLPAGGGSLPRGYEIHLGHTRRESGCPPLLRLRREDGTAEVDDGAVSADGRTAGSYLHGLLDDDGFRRALVGGLREACGLAPAAAFCAWTRERNARFDRLADHVRAALDVPALASWLAPRVPIAARARAGSGAC